jgi:hypothetical protein
VTFSHRRDLPREVSDDYRVLYEAVFEPTSLDQMRAEIWLSDGGTLGVGFELEARLAQRVGRRPPAPRPYQPFAWGFEPMPLQFESVLFLLGLASRGEVGLEYPRSWWSLGSNRAIVAPGHRASLRRMGFRRFRERAGSDILSFGLALLEYRPWT